MRPKASEFCGTCLSDFLLLPQSSQFLHYLDWGFDNIAVYYNIIKKGIFACSSSHVSRINVTHNTIKNKVWFGFNILYICLISKMLLTIYTWSKSCNKSCIRNSYLSGMYQWKMEYIDWFWYRCSVVLIDWLLWFRRTETPKFMFCSCLWSIYRILWFKLIWVQIFAG